MCTVEVIVGPRLLSVPAFIIYIKTSDGGRVKLKQHKHDTTVHVSISADGRMPNKIGLFGGMLNYYNTRRERL